MFANLRASIIRLAEHKSSVWFLAGISFIESSFFPIPPDVLLVPLVYLQKKRWLWLASVTTIASVLGALLGYGIGYFLYEVIALPLISLYGLQESVALVGDKFNQHAFFAIFTSAFTPIPYKVFTIAGGIFSLSLPIFIIASLVGRGLRFFIEAFLVMYFGDRVMHHINKYMSWWSLVFVGIIGIIVYIFIL